MTFGVPSRKSVASGSARARLAWPACRPDPLRTHDAVGFEPDEPAFVADPYPVFDRAASGRPPGLARRARALAGGSATRTPTPCSGSGGWAGSSPRGEPADVWDTFNWLHADSILDSEPPKHTRLRALVAKAFARGHIERLRPRVRDLAGGLLDDAAADPAAGPST